jgi:long-chain fatty acid transport protein
MTAAVRSRTAHALVALGLVAWPGSRLHASGFAIENQGARAMGFAGAYIAQAADPSAIYWNPGGVGFLEGSQLYLSGGATSLGTDFTGEGGPYPRAGTLERTDRLFTVLPSLYFTQQVSDDLVLGLGFFAPFGYHSRWRNPDTFTGRYICVDCQVRSWSLSPTVSYRLEDRLAVGLGLDVRFSRFSHQQRLQADPNPFPEPTDVAELTIAGATDTSFGFDAGVLASPSPNVSIGLVYRHKVMAEYDGTASFDQILTGDDTVDEAVQANLPPRQPVRVTHAFPSSFGAGLAVRSGNWTVEGDVVWTFWSSFDTVTLAYPADEGVATTLLPQAYENVIKGSFGLEYLLSSAWAVRGGYSYDHSPQPTTTFSPFLHDEDRHAFGVGGTYRHTKVRLDLFARYLLFRTRTTQGENLYGYEGRYDTGSFQLGAALGYRF